MGRKFGNGTYTLRYGDNSGKAEETEVYIDRREDISISIAEAGHIFFDPSGIEANVVFSNGDTAQTKDIVVRVYTEEENELVLEDVASTLEMKPYERFAGKLSVDLTNK